MSSKRYSLIVIATTLLAIAATQSQITTYVAIPSTYFDIAAFLGLALILFWLVLWLLAKTPKPVTTIYSSRIMKADEIDDVYDLIKRLLGSDIAPKSLVQQWVKKNPSVVNVVEKITRRGLKKTQKVCGFYSIFPITEETRVLLETDAIKGSGFSLSDFVGPNEKTSALYIGAVGAEGKRAKGITIQQLIGSVTARLSIDGGRVFVRPLTDDGERLFTKYGFQACSDAQISDGIKNYYLDIPPQSNGAYSRPGNRS